MNTLKPNTKNDAMYRSCTSLLSVLVLAALLNVAPVPVEADCECESLWVISNEWCILTEDCEVEVLVICSGGRLDTANYTLTITGSGGLTICAGGQLNVDGAGTVVLSGGRTSTVNGELNLGISGSTLNITSSCRIDGSGAIDGDASGAQILIEDGVTFTSRTNITGILAITEPNNEDATFINGSRGLVHANKGGTLDLNVDSLGSPSGDWRVSSNARAVLRFTTGCYSLSGRFDVDNGTLDIVASVDDAGVCTTGDLSFTGGTIEVASSCSFSASGSCPSQSEHVPPNSDP